MDLAVQVITEITEDEAAPYSRIFQTNSSKEDKEWVGAQMVQLATEISSWKTDFEPF